ncbi:hypothetical protein ABFS82_10G170400 [Erythranthe guttata]|uniref:SBP-type domain-containing protein n=1 Tax=Erythranthe guttata TaxID=4155 RepID=A0A022RLT2_ERYGU|nr:PREDICTED: squamosa promoter-binding-like protein 17 [Erythranthe guttata]XP_012834385.1 PREDICTED: squamosa promoter-binding-like protein 17 [Erythranthe guttata]EYU39920.1 hypothetical protein MIMGU_mgv1a009499mg [Erythranthe guttata]|eukprot:XP_012834384.1 PREDICTED: squamosa promoter-binding-like protein 17 [Erythranthe guttata]
MEKGSSSAAAAVGGAADDGLKFGKKIYFEGVGSGKQHGGGPKSPAKKVRSAAAQGGQTTPRCQVEGCKLDLSDAKAYYSRHKVCGFHSKSPKVIVAGLEQRFCQQCSRFHQLPEFDQDKRSCRRRLAGHNERRRKPPPGTLFSPRYGSPCPSMFDNHSKSGGIVMDFTNYSSLAGSGNQAAIGGKHQLPSWQNNSLSGLVQGSTSGPRYSGVHSGVPTEHGCYGGASSGSSSALSLLSNQPWGSSRGRSLSLGANNFLDPGAAIGQFPCSSSWGFKDGQVGNNSTLHEMPPDLVLGQTSHTGNSHYTGELGLGQPNEVQFHELDYSRGYDSSVQHMHWSL